MLVLLDAKILCYLMSLIYFLHSSALLRSTIRKMDVSRLTRLLTYTKYAVHGSLCPKLNGDLCKMPRTNICKSPCNLSLHESLRWSSRPCRMSFASYLSLYASRFCCESCFLKFHINTKIYSHPNQGPFWWELLLIIWYYIIITSSLN